MKTPLTPVYYYRKSVAPMFAPTMFTKRVNPSKREQTQMEKGEWECYVIIYWGEDHIQEMKKNGIGR